MSVKSYLNKIIGSDVSEDIVEYIKGIKQEDDFNEFMESVATAENARDIEHLKLLLFKENQKPKSKSTQQNQRKNTNNANINYTPDKSNSNNFANVEQTGSNISGTQGKGKKTKYVNLYSQDNKVGLRKGRHPCDCQATKHELINNCTSCGRIICEQEGSGPCFFCDEMVCTRDEMQILKSGSKESSRLYNQLMEQKKSKEFKRAIENRNRLIMTDQLGSAKNKVFDDQNDYFDSNSTWNNLEEKTVVRRRARSAYEQLHRNRRDLKLALDFASRTVTVESDEFKKHKDQLMKGVNKLLDQTENRFPKNLFEGEKADLMTEIVKLMEQTSMGNTNKTLKKETNLNTNKEPNRKYRIANNDFLESVDQGMCLSMHQPWASLLISGIKIHEGRTWKTDHRGRLWIAAAAKEPEDEEILACEEMYRILYNDPTLEFPKKYPTGCLLGCVIIDDCMSQKEYREIYPGGESESPYVFICSSPVVLPIFYPMQGQHKIFQLPKELHKTAKAALMSGKWM